MRVRLRQRTIRQRVVAIIKLSNVASEVFSDRELAARMYLFVAVRPQHQIVANDQTVTVLYGMFNLLRCV